MKTLHFSGQRVLVAGGTGLIGIPLVELLIEQGSEVKIASLDDSSRAHPKAIFRRIDLTDQQNCLEVTTDIDYVFNLLCVKGSPLMMREHPATFFDTLRKLSANLAEASLKNKVGGYLFASSVAVYHPSEILKEDDVWMTMPSKNDWFAGWAKRMGELQIEAYKIEHGWNNTAIVRPSNVYGPYDNFDPDTSLFMASIIRKFAERQNPIIVWGDGSQIRDFIHARDAARGIILAAEKAVSPINLCSGRPTTIREVVEILARDADYKPEIIFDTTKPAGDQRRLLDTTRLEAMGFRPEITLETGILETKNWIINNPNLISKQYDIFGENIRRKR